MGHLDQIPYLYGVFEGERAGVHIIRNVAQLIGVTHAHTLSLP
jgi:hypothetical protein